MTVDEHNEPSDDSQRVAELQKQVDGMQRQITEMNQTREATEENPKLFSKVQNLKKKLDEHSKQLEQSAEKLSQLQSENTVLRDQNQARSIAGNKKRRFNTQVRPMGNLNTPNSREGTTDPPPGSGVAEATREGAENHQVHNLEESDSEPESDKETPEKNISDEVLYYSLSRDDVLQKIRRHAVHGGTPTRSSSPNPKERPRRSYRSIQATDARGCASKRIPRGYNVQRLWLHSDRTCPTWYINLPTRSISTFASLSDMFVEQFTSSKSLEKTSDGLYEILQHRVEPLRDYIAHFNQEKVAVPECSIPTAISAFKRGLLPDGGLYKELTMYPCKTMEDVLSRAWAQVKWEEGVASRAKVQPKQDQKSA
ncbi:hypothetical protein F2Q69_00046067 [Brassica cretica]|uniref:Retrotransposon gag domain-containing protein n=1 Tax=Brassica cretica TaxID=69181 RepID=A0A8S9PWQ5_BRACR|nr:hypothetical protein F2Q69_00046067 [Brassica cretica]